MENYSGTTPTISGGEAQTGTTQPFSKLTRNLKEESTPLSFTEVKDAATDK